MLSTPELTFKARIKVGTPIFHDHGFYRWPRCAAPRGGWDADPDMEFTASLNGDDVWLVAPGYGELGGDYGNGSIGLKGIDGLIVDETTKQKLIEILIERRRVLVDRQFADAHKIQCEIDALEKMRA